MKEYVQLLEFTYKLIEIQIQKYTALAKRGVGPDAGINAMLVIRQVEELFEFSNELLACLENKKSDQDAFLKILKQIHFYVQQEYLRAHAGWLIDENNIHATVFKRVQEYQNELNKIIAEHELKIPESVPMTDIQSQCEHDSHAIAFKITDIVINIKKNPEMEFSDSVPKHAQKIMRDHAREDQGRYYNSDIFNQVLYVNDKCKNFLDYSNLQTNTEKPSKDLIAHKNEEHTQKFQHLLSRLKKCEPNSVLFSSDPGWFAIAIAPVNREYLASGSSSSFFNKVALPIVAVSAMALFIYNLMNSTENDLTNNLGLR